MICQRGHRVVSKELTSSEALNCNVELKNMKKQNLKPERRANFKTLSYHFD